MRVLKIEIDCGEKTCASEPGVLCRFLRARIDGSRPICYLFGVPLYDEDGSILGWLQRCDECKEMEIGEHYCPHRDERCDPACTEWPDALCPDGPGGEEEE